MLVFKPETHQYFSDSKELISCTTLMRKHGLAPDYSNVDKETLERKAKKGSYVHKEIELYIKNHELGFTNELQLFIDKERELDRVVKHSELLVYNDIVAGQVDLIFDGNIVADIKNTYQLHKDPLRWQISIYTYLYDKEHYGDYKGECWWFHNDTLDVVEIELLPIELVERLMECERNGELFTIDYNMQDITELVGYMKAINELNKKVEELKGKINNQVKTFGSFKNDDITITYSSASSSLKFDEDLFKKENPELWAKYNTKKVERKESVKYTLKGSKNE